MRRRVGSAVLVMTCVALGISVAAQAQDGESPFKNGQTAKIHYYNGTMRVERLIALDELAVVSRTGRALKPSEVSGPGLEVVAAGDGGKRVIVKAETPAANLLDLNARAAVLVSPDAEVGAVAYPASAPERSDAYRETVTNRLSVGLRDASSLDRVLRDHDLSLEKTMGTSYVLIANGGGLLAAVDAANALYEGGLATFATPLFERQQQARLIPNDTYFSQQWHLRNTGQVSGSIAGNDVNIVPVWDTYTGEGVNIAITDSGVQVAHPDLTAHARTDIDLDINGNDSDPSPQSSSHGTAVAGMAAAVGNNNLGVTGAAFDAGIVGIRLIEAVTTDDDEATAMAHQIDAPVPEDRVHVNNNSWGPADCGCVHATFGPLTEAALNDGVTHGRGGLGVVYVWAAGNGRESNDNVNYDGYASSRYTIAVGATGGNGVVSYYSEPGASMLVNTPSSYGSVGTTTTTRVGVGNLGGDYSTNFGGTSSASPLAAGSVALMLEANPGLGWRDVQYILVDTAFKNHAADAGWISNGGDRLFNHNYGFGRIDTVAAVARAETWVNMEDETVLASPVKAVGKAIPDFNPTGVSDSIPLGSVPDRFFVEHVEVVLNATHPRSGDLGIELTSPSGTQSILAKEHSATGSYSNWKFTSVAHWGEDPSGVWTLRLHDESILYTGQFVDWKLIVYGVTIDTDVVAFDAGHGGVVNGHPNWPYTDFHTALNAVDSGGTLALRSNVSLQAPQAISKPVTMTASGGTVRISAP